MNIPWTTYQCKPKIRCNFTQVKTPARLELSQLGKCGSRPATLLWRAGLTADNAAESTIVRRCNKVDTMWSFGRKASCQLPWRGTRMCRGESESALQSEILWWKECCPQRFEKRPYSIGGSVKKSTNCSCLMWGATALSSAGRTRRV